MSELYTDRLFMRPFSKTDAEPFIDLKTHPENMAGTNVGALDAGSARDLLNAYLAQWQQIAIGMWALIDIETGTFIGECGFAKRPGFDGLTLRYTIDRHWWGRGLAPESVAAVLAYGKLQPGLGKVSALAMGTNIRSCRILEQAGMEHVENDFAGVPGFRRYVLALNG